MFDVKIQDGNQVLLFGRFDASQTDKVGNVLDTISENCVIDFRGLEYISSAGLGLLIKTYNKLRPMGKSIVLRNLNKHVSEVFRYAGLDKVFYFEQSNQ